ncbi:MAG: hypothetical protein AB1425_04690 [Actinomycetota bacterium]
MDCFIVRVAIEHDLFLLHDNRLFERIAVIVSEFKLARVRSPRGKRGSLVI